MGSHTKLYEKVGEMLLSKGVEISVFACGCCGGPSVTIKIDGVTVVDNEDNFNLDMLGEDM